MKVLRFIIILVFYSISNLSFIYATELWSEPLNNSKLEDSIQKIAKSIDKKWETYKQKAILKFINEKNTNNSKNSITNRLIYLLMSEKFWNAWNWCIWKISWQTIEIINQKWKTIVKQYYSWNDYNIFYTFNDWLMKIRDEKSSLFGFIDSSGNWVIKPKFNDAENFSGWISLVINIIPNGKASTKAINTKWEYIEIDVLKPYIIWDYKIFPSDSSAEKVSTWEKYPDVRIRKKWIIITDKTWHILVMTNSWNVLLPFWEYKLESRNISIAFDLSWVATEKWWKWSPAWFEDYSYDYFLFWFVNHWWWFWLTDGLAVAWKGETNMLIDSKTNKVVYIFPNKTSPLNIYWDSENFFQINDNIIAVNRDKWIFINREWKKIIDWYEKFSFIQLSTPEDTVYIIGIKKDNSDIIKIQNEKITILNTWMNVKSATLNDWKFELYKDYYQKDIVWTMTIDGVVKKITR